MKPTNVSGCVAGIIAALVVACSGASNEGTANGGGAAGSSNGPGATAPSGDSNPSANDGGTSVGTSDGGTSNPGSSTTTCGARGGMRGLTKRSLTVAGLARTYLVYLPPSLAPSSKAPFVFVFHGYTMSGQQMHDLTQYEALADREGVAVVFPDGEGGPDSNASPWNVENAGQTVCGYGQDAVASGDDFSFMDAIVADVAADQCIDASHVFATGFSMGGYFSHHIACYRNDVRGVAPHSGGTIGDLSACTTGHVPMILFHGTSDSVIAPACDDPHAKAESGFVASATLWAAKNGCQSTTTSIATDGAGGGKGTCFLYDGCPSDGQVELCTFTGMDHCWAGGSTAGAGGDSACPTYASATELEWAFWKKYAW